jgi:ubiquinone/menaquinone biosynthesis C-methylase UbiE
VRKLEAYFDRRAPEYDATSYEAALADPAAAADLALLERFVAGLPGERMLDVGCGTGWLTRRLSGSLLAAVDRSAAMLALARERLPHAVLAVADLAALPFLDGSFDLVFASHVYGHLEPEAARAFATELSRVGGD